MGTQASEAPRVNAFLEDPFDVVLVTDKGQPFYDPRVEYAPDPALVASIAEFGVVTSIVVKKVGTDKVVTDGRQRVLAARAAIEANPKLKGVLKIPTFIRRGDDDRMEDMSRAANIHITDDPITAAMNINKTLDRHAGDAKATAKILGVSVPHVQNSIKLLDLAAPVQKALKDRKLSANAAMELYDLPAAEQVSTLKTLLDAGKASAGAVKKLKKAAATPYADENDEGSDDAVTDGADGDGPADGEAPAEPKAPKAKKDPGADVFNNRPSLKLLRRLTETLAAENEDEFVFLLKWVTGEISEATAYKKLQWLRDAVREAQADRRFGGKGEEPEVKVTAVGAKPKAAKDSTDAKPAKGKKK